MKSYRTAYLIGFLVIAGLLLASPAWGQDVSQPGASGVAGKLKTATGQVSIGTAAAPSAGQVLTATSASAASLASGIEG